MGCVMSMVKQIIVKQIIVKQIIVTQVIAKQMLVSSLLLSSAIVAAGFGHQSVQALPPPDDVPEEVLRREIIIDARSPLDGTPMTAAEYAELQAKLGDEADIAVPLSPGVRHTVYLLRLLNLLRTVNPL
jgi:hypothetical protein